MSKTPLKQDLQGGAYKAALGGLVPGQQDGMAQGMDDLMQISQNLVTNIAERKNQAKKTISRCFKKWRWFRTRLVELCERTC